MGVGRHQAYQPGVDQSPGFLVGRRAEVAQQTAGGDLQDGAGLDPGVDALGHAGEIAVPFGVRHDRLDAALVERDDRRQRIDEHLVRQLQQQVAAGVGDGQDLVGFQQSRQALVDAHVGAGEQFQRNSLGREHRRQVGDGLADAGGRVDAVVAAELMRRADDGGHAVVDERFAQVERVVERRRARRRPPAGSGSERRRSARRPTRRAVIAASATRRARRSWRLRSRRAAAAGDGWGAGKARLFLRRGDGNLSSSSVWP